MSEVRYLLDENLGFRLHKLLRQHVHQITVAPCAKRGSGLTSPARASDRLVKQYTWGPCRGRLDRNFIQPSPCCQPYVHRPTLV